MWLLVHEPPKPRVPKQRSHPVCYYLLPDKKFSVGRRDCSLTLNEQTINRKHAVIELVPDTKGHSGRSHSVVVTDDSTYGTFINRTKLLKSQRTLKEGDQLVFSTQEEYFDTCYIRWEPVVVYFYNFRETVMQAKQLLYSAEIPVLDKWEEEVSHLVMSEIITTSKVLLALSRRVHIVSLSWVERFAMAVKNFKPIPDPASYLPQLTEKSDIDDVTLFLPDDRRAKLFEGKHFYFLSESEYNHYQLPVSNCSGVSTLVDISDITFATFDRYVVPESFVITGNSPPFSGNVCGNGFITSLKSRMEGAGKSMVNDTCIFRAILHLSNDFLSNAHDSRIFVSQKSGQYSTPYPSQPHLVLSKKEPDTKSIDMFSLFDEENADQFESPLVSQRSSNGNLQAPVKQSFAAVLMPSNGNNTSNSGEYGDMEVVPDIKIKEDPLSPPLVPFQCLDRSQNDVAPEPMATSPLHAPQHDTPLPFPPRQSINRFIKNPWPGMGKKRYLKKDRWVTAVTDVEPIPYSSDEAELPDTTSVCKAKKQTRKPKNLQQSQKQSQARITQSPTTPKTKRASTFQSPRSSKRSLFVSQAQSETDSDNDSFLRVTPLSKYN